MKANSGKFKLVIQQYKSGQFKRSELARRHGVCSATVSNWIRMSGCTRGSRGRPPFEEPTTRQKEMLHQVWTDTYGVVAARFGVTKQYMGKLLQRWQGWTKREFGPRCIKAGSAPKNSEKLKTRPRTLQPNVISFRIADSVLAKILVVRGYKDQFRSRSLHYVARELLLAGIEQQQQTVTSVVEPIQTGTVCTTNSLTTETQNQFSIYGIPRP